jgi:hypothetical protein
MPVQFLGARLIVLGYLTCHLFIFEQKAFSKSDPVKVIECTKISLRYQNKKRKWVTIENFCGTNNQVFNKDELLLKSLQQSKIHFSCSYQTTNGKIEIRNHKFPNRAQSESKIIIERYCNTLGARLGDDDTSSLLIGGIDNSLPFVISPRRGFISGQPPYLRWKAVKLSEPFVEGKYKYRISLYQEGNTTPVWKHEMPYRLRETGDESLNLTSVNPIFPTLQQYTTYWFDIKLVPSSSNTHQGSTTKHQSSMDNVVTAQGNKEPMYFSRFDLNPSEGFINDNDIDRAINLSRATYLMEAIDILEKSQQNTPKKYQVLGSIYGQVGLSEHMQVALNKAIKLSKDQNTGLFHRAEAESLLAQWYIAQAKRVSSKCREYSSQAQTYIDAASRSYQEAKEPGLAEEVKALSDSIPQCRN